jgi:hypothetical protein
MFRTRPDRAQKPEDIRRQRSEMLNRAAALQDATQKHLAASREHVYVTRRLLVDTARSALLAI